MRIKCQQKHTQKGTSEGGWGGCGSCGGYGFIMSEVELCSKCKRKGWVRPGAHTVYEGKTFRTVDGIDLVYSKGMKVTCFDCLEGKKK